MRVFPAFRRPLQFLQNFYLGHPFRLFSATLKTFFIAHLIWDRKYAVASTWGPSMLPTLEVRDDWVIVDRWYRRGRGIKVGDVVSFDSVYQPGEKVIKRVVALEGDYVLRGSPSSGDQTMLQVPQGHCWVVGDNLPASRDSREWGPLPMGLIRGKITAKIFPFSERRWFADGLESPRN